MAQQDAQNGVAENVAAAVSFLAVKPQLLVEAPKANDAVSFYKAAFGAEEVSRALNPKRKADHELPLILSAELKIAGSTILVADLVDDSTSPLVFSGYVHRLYFIDLSILSMFWRFICEVLVVGTVF